MTTLWQSKQVAARQPLPVADDATDVIAIVGDFVVPAGLAAGDVIEMGGIQGNYVPIDLIVSFDDCDSNGVPTIKFDAGMISGTFRKVDNTRTCGAEFLSADTTAQAGGVARMNQKAGTSISPVDGTTGYPAADRGWGLKVNTAAATLTAGAKIRATLIARPSIDGV